MFENIVDGLGESREQRLANAVTKLSYGIRYLDQATGGIRTHDLVIIGGRTGAGKTELASIIAQNNALAGKRVLYYALEAEQGEITNRLLFRVFSKIYYDKIYPKNLKPISYIDFIDGNYDRQYINEMIQAETTLRVDFDKLSVFYRNGEFGIKDLVKSMEESFADTDLFIIDHLHHFDFDGSITELMQIKTAIKTLRDTALQLGKPVIVIAHLRKGDRQSKQIVPDLEEFYGSSEISKEATQVITIAPYDMDLDKTPYNYPTLFKICKYRKLGSVVKFIGMQSYNAQTNKYDETVILGKLTDSGTVFEEIKENKPHWSNNL